MEDDPTSLAARLFGLSRPEDRKVLEQLIVHGDDLSRRRHTLLVFHRRDEDDASDSAPFDRIVVAGADFGFKPVDRDEFELVLEGWKFVDPENLEGMIAWAIALAEDTGTEFDGWECALDTGPAAN